MKSIISRMRPSFPRPLNIISEAGRGNVSSTDIKLYFVDATVNRLAGRMNETTNIITPLKYLMIDSCPFTSSEPGISSTNPDKIYINRRRAMPRKATMPAPISGIWGGA